MPNDLQTWGISGTRIALQQVAGSVERRLGLHVEFSGDAFTATAPASPDFTGPEKVSARVADGVIEIEVTLPAARGRGPMDLAIRYMAKLDQKRVRFRVEDDRPRLDLQLSAAPLDPVRLANLEQQFAIMAEFAVAWRAEAPEGRCPVDQEKLYEPVKEIAEPVTPLAPNGLGAKVREALDPAARYLRAGTSVALATASRIEQQYAEAALASLLPGYGILTLGRLRIPGVSPKGLIEIRGKSPGPLVVHASQLITGTSRWERDELRPALELLATRGEGTVFSGAYEEISQAFVFQGAKPTPTLPAIVSLPAGLAPLSDLCRFAVQLAGAGQLPAKAIGELAAELHHTLARLPNGGAERILPELARNTVLNWSGAARVSSADMARSLLSLKQTFAGAPPPAIVTRHAEVQGQLMRVLDPGLSGHLKGNLAGQDGAIDELVRRLRAEVLGRPLHQPLRWAALGPPGVGKSDSARLIAEWIGVPYESIDLGSFADAYTANAQLRGSGRGLVGSNEMGRIEALSKVHGGVVVEFADLDHAPPHVRPQLADLCLQILDKGAFETANGATCSAANLILAFTLNLPGGRDEKLARGMGFQQGSNRAHQVHRAIEELKAIVSTAFLSRVGTPILFGPLGEEALAVILERSVRRAVDTACERLGVPIPAWRMPERLGHRLLALAPGQSASLGARGLTEHARAYATEAAAEAIGFLRSAPAEVRVQLDEAAQRLEITE
jgi:hypothetical protein